MAYEIGGPTGQIERVTPHDTNYVRGEKTIFDWLRIGGAGTVVITKPDGTDITITALAGEYVPYRGVRIKSTGTTATEIDAAFPDKLYT